MSDDVQSADTGDQGADATDSGLYDLDSVAPEEREQIVPHLKAIEGNVTKKFQEAAAYRKQWEPYEELGLNELEPEQLKGLLEFAAMANDPEQFGQWWENAGKELGLFEKFGGSEDSELDELEDLSPERVQELIAEQVGEKLSPVEEMLQKQQQDQQVAEAAKEVDEAMAQIRKDNASLFEGDAEAQKQVEQRIARLAYAYADDSKLSPGEMIQKGLEDYKEMIGEGENGLFKEKVDQPKPPEGPGAADTSPEKISSFDDPRFREAAEAKIRNAS
jgi:hypothetical protein